MIRMILAFLNKVLFNRTTLIATICIWVLVQIFLVYTYYSAELIGDPGYYVYYATECAHRGTMYPDFMNYHDQYIFAPGWVNFLTFCIKFFGNVDFVPYLNIIFNIFIVYFIYQIAQKISGGIKSVAYIAVYVFIVLPANTTMVTTLYSEIFFEVLAIASFYLILKNKYHYWIIAGILIALAYWTRPLALAWIIAAVCFLWFTYKKIRIIGVYVISIVITCITIAYSTRQNFPDYIYSASTGGVNLIMGANDLATGLYCYEARDKGGLGYLPGLYSADEYIPVKAYATDSTFLHKYSNRYSYKECDSIWKARSVDWILNHPIKWVSMLPYKTYALFSHSGFYIPNFAHYDNVVVKSYCRVFAIILFKMMILVVLYGAFVYLWKTKESIYILLPIILCSGMTLVTVAMARYNFIMLPNIVIAFAMTLRYLKGKYLKNSFQQNR